MKYILVTGAKGQLGQELKYRFGDNHDYKCSFIDIEELDLLNGSLIEAYFLGKKVDFIINCAAYTAVDKAEEDVDIAFKLNKDVPSILSCIANQLNAMLIHISTDFVFDGSLNRPLAESDLTKPLSVYGKSKLEGEGEVQNRANKYFIIRSSWLYSTYGNNFVKTILKLISQNKQVSIISDQYGTPTYAGDLTSFILEIISSNSEEYGIYHFSNEGVASWYDFAHAIADESSNSTCILPILTSEYVTAAERPKFSVMSKRKVKETFGFQFKHWTVSLNKCLKLMRDQQKKK